jgi:CheY-like chemotaxis protein
VLSIHPSIYDRYISHEFRTPMSILLSAVEVVLSECQKPSDSVSLVEISETAADAKSTCLAIVDVLDDLLLYEDLERCAGKVDPLRYSDEDPEEYLRQTIGSYAQEAARADLQLVLHPLRRPEGLVGRLQVRMDKRAMRSALNALVYPAVRSQRREGSLEVRLELHLRQSEGDGARNRSTDWELVVLIADSRSGLSADETRQLEMDSLHFAHFEREGHEDGRGGGFQFWIARRVLQMHGTVLTVRVEEGVVRYELRLRASVLPDTPSSRVKVAMTTTSSARQPNVPTDPLLDTVLPGLVLRKGDAALRREGVGVLRRVGSAPSLTPSSVPPQKQPSAARSASVGEFRSLHLLVVDDSALNRKMMVKLLRGMGHTCIEADDGSTGVEAVRSSYARIDAILMDNQMPTMMGQDATRVIREQLGYSGLVVGVTGNALVADVQEFLNHGAHDVVAKPLTPQKFAEILVKFNHLLQPQDPA